MSTEDLASLGIVVDASQVTPAATQLDKLTASGAQAEKQTDQLTVSAKELSDALKATGGDLQKATALLAAQKDATNKVADANKTATSATQAATAAIKDQASAATATGAANAAAANITVNAHGAVNASAIKVRESLVLLREAANGNFTRMAGSASILAQAFGLLNAANIALAASILLPVAAFGLAAAAVVKYNEQQEALQNIANGVGRTVALTAQQITDAANEAANASNISTSAALAQATQYAETGRIGGDMLAGLTEAAQKYADATGQKVTQATSALAKAFSDPAKGAEELDSTLNILNATQLQNIENMAKSGDTAGAQKALLDALNKSLSNVTQNTTLLGRAWIGVSNFFHLAVTGFAQGVDILTGDVSLEQKFQNANDKLQATIILTGQYSEATKEAAAEVQKLGNQLDAAKAKQAALTATAQAQVNTKAAVAVSNSLHPDQQNYNNLVNQANQVFQGLQDASTAGESPAVISQLTKDYAALGDTINRLTDAEGNYIPQATRDHQIEMLKAQAAATTDKTEKGALQTQISKLQLASQVLTNSELQTKATDAGNVVADKANDLSKDGIKSATEKLLATQNLLASQIALNQALENGTLSLADEAKQSKINSDLSHIQAEADVATGAAKQKLLDIIAKLRPELEALYDQQQITAQDKENQKTQEKIDLLNKEISLVGKSNLEAATALAIAKEQAALNDKGISPSDPSYQKAIEQAIELATAQQKLTTTQDEYNSSLRETTALWENLDSAGNSLAKSLTTSFGNVGTALGNVITTTTAYGVAQSKIADQQAALVKKGETDTKQYADLTKQSQQNELDYYGNVAGAAADFFSKKSGIYKALTAADTLFHTIEIANAIASIGVETASTAASTANAAAQGTAWGIVAQVKALAAYPPPWNFIALGAVTAALVAIGVSLFSGGGSDAAPAQDTSAQDQQAIQGTGTVFGDPTAQSASIQNSLDLFNKDQNQMLEYSNEMVTALQAIQDSIGKVSALLGQQLGLSTGAFNTDKLGLGSTSDSGFLGLFGGSTSTTTLTDEGLNFGPQTVATILANGIKGTSYQNTQTVTQDNGFLGIGGGTETKNNSYVSGLDPTLEKQVTATIGALKDEVVTAATKLGISGADAAIDAFTLNIGKISLKGLTGSQITDALNAVFSEVGDEFASTAAPQILALQKAGEGALETLNRLVDEYTTVDDVMKSIGSTFNGVGIDSVAARDRLVQLSGGLDQFTSQGQYFVDNFLTDAQKIAPIQQAVTQEMTSLGYASVTTKEQFVSLVQSINTSTEAGAELYSALMNVAPAFGTVADAATKLAQQQMDLNIQLAQAQGDTAKATALQRQEGLAALDPSLRATQEAIYAAQDLATAQQAQADAAQQATQAAQQQAQADLETAQAAQQAANDNVQKATQDLTDAYNAQASSLNSVITQFQNFQTSLESFKATLETGDLANNNAIQQYAATKAVFDATAAKAATGDSTALQAFQQTAEDFLNASKVASPTEVAYEKDLAAVKTATEAAEKASQTQIDTATKQLNALTDEVSQLITINTSVMSVTDAINELLDYEKAKDAADAAEKAAEATAAGGSGATSGSGSSVGSYGAGGAGYDASTGAWTGPNVLPFTPPASGYTPNANNPLLAFTGIGAFDYLSGQQGADFINTYYQQTLGRSASQDEIDAWQTAGGTGVSRSVFVNDVLNSPEYLASHPHYAGGGVFTNGVVSQPTMFSYGEMGEDGPEAIVPLVRGPNGLGVRVNGAGGNADMNATLKAIHQALVNMGVDTKRTATILRRVTLDGNSLQTTAAA